MEAVVGSTISTSDNVEVFTSHEGLHLNYELAQTRQVPRREGWYNLNTHMPWIGYRTRNIDGAHVEYFRGIENPIGLKVGPKMDPQELVALVKVLNSENEPGHVTLIHRLGAKEIETALPPLIEAVEKAKLKVLWCSDPMHGNTYATDAGIKTRDFDQIASELEQAFDIHAKMGTYLGGVHLETSGENVTECIGGPAKLAEPDLKKAYKSAVDPRLNYDQSMELAFLIAGNMKKVS